MKVIDQSIRILRPTSPERAAEGLKLVEYAGRNCYNSFDKITDDSYDDFISSLIARKHLSPLEFEDMTVEMIVGRDVMAEITRHRLASFAIRSQRYVADDKHGEISFIKPDFWVPETELHDDYWYASRDWEEDMRYLENRYKRYKELYGLKNQQRRVIMPNSAATCIIMKSNLREWLHIFDLRDSDGAYPLMRDVMRMLLPQASHLYPTVFGMEEAA